MIFGHILRVAQAVIREQVIKRITRSNGWSTVRKHWLEQNPRCAACGSGSILQVHHVEPFHLHPKLELDPSNLITLCEGRYECHLHIGHSGNFKGYNPRVRDDAAAFQRADATEREQMIAHVKKQILFAEG